jgi:hypothetical protein
MICSKGRSRRDTGNIWHLTSASKIVGYSANVREKIEVLLAQQIL